MTEIKYEESFAKLKLIVERLEKEPLDLEESLTLFQEGQQLAQSCQALLEKAEMTIRTLQTETEDLQQNE